MGENVLEDLVSTPFLKVLGEPHTCRCPFPLTLQRALG